MAPPIKTGTRAWDFNWIGDYLDRWFPPKMTHTLPPSSRQRGTVTAKAVHDRRISSADEADLRDDGGTT